MSNLSNYSDEKLREELAKREAARKLKVLEEGQTRMTFLKRALETNPPLVNVLAPTHSRSSCNDDNTENGYAPEGTDAMRCVRCYLLDLAFRPDRCWHGINISIDIRIVRE